MHNYVLQLYRCKSCKFACISFTHLEIFTNSSLEKQNQKNHLGLVVWQFCCPLFSIGLRPDPDWYNLLCSEWPVICTFGVNLLLKGESFSSLSAGFCHYSPMFSPSFFWSAYQSRQKKQIPAATMIRVVTFIGRVCFPATFRILSVGQKAHFWTHDEQRTFFYLCFVSYMSCDKLQDRPLSSVCHLYYTLSIYRELIEQCYVIWSKDMVL